MKITAPPRSDQWNADDFVGGPRTFTIAAVRPGKAEQKYDIELVEGEGRVWRPPLTVLRQLIRCWGDDSTQWIGRKVTLVLDETVTFGGNAVGGIRISHLSHLDKPTVVVVSASKNKKQRLTVLPLATPEPATAVSPEMIANCTDSDTLRQWWSTVDPALQPALQARAAELKAGADG